jgi:hypothetical protein
LSAALLGKLSGLGQVILDEETIPGIHYMIDVFRQGSSVRGQGALRGDVLQVIADTGLSICKLSLQDGSLLVLYIDGISSDGTVLVSTYGAVPGF